MNPLLDIRSLTTAFINKNNMLKAVDDIHFSLNSGETLALVGESGSGKSITALSILRLVPAPGKIISGEIYFNDQHLLNLSEKQMRNIRGRHIGLILQDSGSALNPVMKVGEQIAEIYRHHFKFDRKKAFSATVDLLAKVKLSNAELLYHAYPHQLSGGMRQRVLIAGAIACKPALVIADEPTSALDASLQSEILALLNDLKREMDLSLLLISHDLAMVSQIADRVAVMQNGKIVEQNTTEKLFTEPEHMYTKKLLNAIPKIEFGAVNSSADKQL